jgi:hypothetical protein
VLGRTRVRSYHASRTATGPTDRSWRARTGPVLEWKAVIVVAAARKRAKASSIPFTDDAARCGRQRAGVDGDRRAARPAEPARTVLDIGRLAPALRRPCIADPSVGARGVVPVSGSRERDLLRSRMAMYDTGTDYRLQCVGVG